MQDCSGRDWGPGSMLTYAAALNHAQSVDAAVDESLDLLAARFDRPVATLYEFDAATESLTVAARSAHGDAGVTAVEPPPQSAVERGLIEGVRLLDEDSGSVGSTGDDDESLGSVALVPVDAFGVLRVGSTTPDAFDEADAAVLEGVGAALGAALDRFDRPSTEATTEGTDSRDGELALRRAEDAAEADADALRRLHDIALVSDGFETPVDRLLSLGCDHFGLDVGLLARVDGTDYHVEAAVDPSDTFEQGATFDLGETICDATLARDATEPLAFADVAETGHSTHPAARDVDAYVGAPVVVDGDVYGTVHFSSAAARAEPIRPGEREFVKLVAQLIGSGIENRRRIAELERHETVIEAVDDPVYALDGDGHFTFLNEAAQREFGYGDDSLGEHVSIGMADADVELIRGQIQRLLASNDRSAVSQFELATADGRTKTVENRLALIGDDEFRGSAGVLRDVTEREADRQRLESFQRAVEEAADGVAILDDGEYTYVDDTHVEMYGFDSEADLLGETWRVLYDDDEVERLESEVFPVLEADGHWRGMVSGRRPDGSTFPAELSLTVVEDGRLVCTVRDETERQARERDLELKERAMDETNVSIQITDPTRDDNPLVYVNDGFETVTGYSEAEALGRNPRFLQGADADPAAVATLREAIDAEEPVTIELQNRRADGTQYWAKLSITPVYDDDGELANFIGIQQDVTERRGLVESLEDRTERLELVLSGTGTGIAEWDLRTDAVTWDETLVETFGRNPKTIDEFVEVVHPDDRERTQGSLERMLETGEPWSGAFRVLTGDDETAWIGTRALPVYEDGEPVTVLATGTDITERKADERALEQSQERYRTLLQAAPDPVFVADAETGEIVETNAAAEAVRGESRDEIIGRHQTELHPGDDPAAYRRAFAESVGETAMLSELDDGTRPRLRTVDGESIPVEINVDTVELPQGPVRYGVFRDISDRVERERELELKERAMDEANVGITISDPDEPDNPIVYLNDGFTEQTGYGREDALGENCRFLQGDDRDQRALDALRDAIEDEEPVTVELRNYRKDGEQFWNRLSVTPVYDDDALVNYIGIQQDVTAEKTREQRLRTLHGTTREFLEADDSYGAATVAVKTLCEELDVERAGVYLQDGDELVLEASLGWESEQVPERVPERVEPDRSPVWDAFERGESVVYGDVGDVADDVDRGAVAASAYFPLGGHGVVAVGATDPAELGASERRLIEVLTGNLATALGSLEREASLRASERRYRNLAENIPNGAVLTFDADLQYRLAEGELLSALGLGQSDFSGTEAGDVLPDSDAKDELLPAFRAALDGERTDRRIELRGRILQVYVVPVDTDDEETDHRSGLVLAQDVTDETRRERELFEERERFQLMTESVDEYAFLTVDEDGAVDTWNDGATNLFGYDAETALGTPTAQFHPAAERASGLPDRLLQQARITGESAHEGWHVRADGSEFYADVRYALLQPDDGASQGYVMVVRDMTDRRRQRRRTEQFVEESDDVVSVVAPDGTLTYVSGSANRVLGYEPEALVDENLFDYLHPDGREAAMATFFGVLEGDADSAEAEFRVRSADDEWLNVEAQCRDMRDDDAIDGVLLYLRDVTESKETARKFEGIFNQTFQFTGLLEPDGTVVEANDAALEFGGFEREDVVGERFHEAPWWTHSEETSAAVHDAVERAANGEFVRYETDARGVDGIATLDFSAKPVTDEDDAVSLVVVEGRNITEQRRQRQQLDVMQRVMRHNMRNDLTKVEGYTQLLADEPDPAVRAEHADVVQSVIDRWKEMTASMSKIRKVLRNREGKRPARDATAVVEDAVSAVDDTRPDVTVVTETSGLDAPRVPSDVFEALRELVENAMEAATHRDGRVEVTASRPDEDWVEVAVVDDGSGLPDMEAEVLETGEETQLNHGGSLGLWMVRTLVTHAGGDVSVDAETDGTTVTLRLPVDGS